MTFSTGADTISVTIDFRKPFYDRYVTTFKVNYAFEEKDIQALWRWCATKYLPLLASVDRTAPILELACGPGYILEFLMQNGFTDAEGIDLSAEQVELAKQRGVKAQEGDVFDFLASTQKKYAAIIAIDLIEHLSKEELRMLLERIHECLQPHGVLLLQTINGSGLLSNHLIYGDMTHSTILSSASLQQLLLLLGFKQIAFSETGPVAKNFVGWLRVLLWRVIRAGANAIRVIETGRGQDIWTQNVICCARRA